MKPSLPLETWDCHTHIYGPWQRFPLAPGAAYQPEAAPFEALRMLHQQLGINRGVLVQAACYGSDHGALMEALARSDGRYRGVALIDDSTGPDQLQQMHAGGVRGIRFNFLGHLPSERDPLRLRRLAERIQPYGWHILLHGQPRDLIPVFAALEGIEVPLVVDHMARQDVAAPVDEPSLRALERHLEKPNGWIKLSGVDRLMGGAPPPWDGGLSIARRLLRCAPTRAIWGSDWPHPNIKGVMPKDADLLDFILEVCSDQGTARAVLSDNPKRLYF